MFFPGLWVQVPVGLRIVPIQGLLLFRNGLDCLGLQVGPITPTSMCWPENGQRTDNVSKTGGKKRPSMLDKTGPTWTGPVRR